MRLALRVFLCTPALAFLATPAFADELFAGCKVGQPQPGQRSIECADFSANATEEKPANGEEATLDLLVRATRERQELRVERGDIDVAGVKRHGLRYFGASNLYGVIAAVPSSAGRFRLLFCEEHKVKKCDLVLAALAKKLPEVNSQSPTADDSFAGRALPTPAGCTRPSPGKLHCANGELTWHAIDQEAPSGLDWLWNALKKAFANTGALSESRRPCELDGVDTDCRLLAIAKPDGAVWTVIGALTTVRKQRMFAQCNLKSAVTARAPAPCDLLFTLR